MKLSFIIPSYNASQTVRRCLNSIYDLPVPEREFEVIVIDDCSTDNTRDVVEEYRAVHGNLKMLRQSRNQRQGAARNRGIDEASGDYIAFLDADDYVLAAGIVKALESVAVSQVDICYFDCEFQAEDGTWHKIDIPQVLRNSTVDSRSYLEDHYTTVFNGPWRSLYRTSFLKETGIRFVEGVQWEDCDWTVKVLSRAKTIQFVDGVGYRYCYNGDSTIRHRNAGTMANRVFAGLRLMEFGENVRETLPRLSGKVTEEGKNQYVVEVLRLRNLTKYPFTEVSTLQELIGTDCRQSLLGFDLPCWERAFLQFKKGSLGLMRIACPCAMLGRKVIRFIRSV